jgi:5-methylcytosine-specific restriction endonuclease McrA
MGETKLCRKCHIEKPVYEFGSRENGLRTWCRACDNEYQRAYYAANIERTRERKKIHMREARKDPVKRDRYNAARRGVEKYRQREREYHSNIRRNHFFIWRARAWSARYQVGITALDLWSLWKSQRGRCALSGRKLDETAHLDHIVPISGNGVHTLDNLRWLDPHINIARRNLTDVQFLEMCHQVVSFSTDNIRSPNH